MMKLLADIVLVAPVMSCSRSPASSNAFKVTCSFAPGSRLTYVAAPGAWPKRGAGSRIPAAHPVPALLWVGREREG